MRGLPAVSVCVPTYNGSAFIGPAIESVLAQTHADFELIVVDDASTDDTAAVVERYTSDPRVRFIRLDQNRGAAGTWNHAVAQSRGHLVKLLCHDDTIEPECLARQVPLFSDPKIVLASCWRRVVDACGRTIVVRRGMGRGTAIDRPCAVKAMVRSGTNLIGEPSATMFRLDTWTAAGGFSGENLYMIDIDCWLKLLRHGVLAFVPEVLCAYRLSPTALSTVLARQQIAAGKRFMQALVDDPANGLHHRDLTLGVTRAVLRSWGRRFLYFKGSGGLRRT